MANHTPTASGHSQTAAPGTSSALFTLLTYSDADGPSDIVGFAVQDITSGGGHLTLNGVAQADNTVFGNSTFGIRISQLSQWGYVVAPSGTVFPFASLSRSRPEASTAVFSISRVTAASANHIPTASGHSQTAAP